MFQEQDQSLGFRNTGHMYFCYFRLLFNITFSQVFSDTWCCQLAQLFLFSLRISITKGFSFSPDFSQSAQLYVWSPVNLHSTVGSLVLVIFTQSLMRFSAVTKDGVSAEELVGEWGAGEEAEGGKRRWGERWREGLMKRAKEWQDLKWQVS